MSRLKSFLVVLSLFVVTVGPLGEGASLPLFFSDGLEGWGSDPHRVLSREPGNPDLLQRLGERFAPGGFLEGSPTVSVNILKDAVAVSAGLYHNCAVIRGGNVTCWPDDIPFYHDFGQSADYFGGDAVSVAAGAYHSCALLVNGHVKCWGGMYKGYNGGDAVAIDASLDYTCALLKGGNVKCWDWDWDNGYFGGDALAVAVGGSVGGPEGRPGACALLANGNVKCWDVFGTPKPGYSGGDALAISVGGAHACAVVKVNKNLPSVKIGNVRCWGDNSWGQSNGYFWGNAVAVAAGNGHTCALLVSGNVQCWGSSLSGGYSGGGAVAVTGHYGHTCVLHVIGYVYCWGSYDWGASKGYRWIG